MQNEQMLRLAEPPCFVDRNIAAARDAYERIRSKNAPEFDDLASGERVMAFAGAAVASEPLLEALRDIVAMETPRANATVKRMATRAALALRSRTGDQSNG